MKKRIVLSLTAFAVVALTALIVISCNKQIPDNINISNTNPDGTPIIDSTQIPAGTSSGPLNICICATVSPSGCPSWVRCARKILPSPMTSRTFSVNWTSCIGCPGCGVNNGSPQTTGIICFSEDCDYLNVQFNNLPECLKDCYGTIVCEKMKLICQGHTYSLIWQTSDGNELIQITGDPHIHIECNKLLNYSMDGDLVFT